MNGFSLADVFQDNDNDNQQQQQPQVQLPQRQRQRSSTSENRLPRSVSDVPLLPRNQSGLEIGNQSRGIIPFESDEPEIIQLQTFIKSYQKLKVIFIILLLFNVALVILYILTNGTFSVKDNENEQNVYSELIAYIGENLPRDKKKSFRLCSYISNIFEDQSFIRNMTFCENQKCCFETTNQLFDLYTKYTSTYVKKIVKEKSSSNCKHNYTKETLLDLSEKKPAFHADYSHTSSNGSSLSMRQVQWKVFNHKFFQFSSSIKERRETLSDVIIPITGFYYIYSNLQFKNGVENGLRHYIDGDIRLMTDSSKSSDYTTASFLQGIFMLKAKSKVRVLVNTDARNSSYFGMYML